VRVSLGTASLASKSIERTFFDNDTAQAGGVNPFREPEISQCSPFEWCNRPERRAYRVHSWLHLVRHVQP